MFGHDERLAATLSSSHRDTRSLAIGTDRQNDAYNVMLLFASQGGERRTALAKVNKGAKPHGLSWHAWLNSADRHNLKEVEHFLGT